MTSPPPDDAFDRLIGEIRACERCAAELPLGPRPIVRGRPAARLLIISQAPGTLVHTTGLSFNDRSGDRLRQWLALDRTVFYKETRVAIVGMGFCYPAATPAAATARRGRNARRCGTSGCCRISPPCG